MPLQRSYDVTSMEGGDDNQKTSPLFTRSCVLWLIGFFVACILILIVCLVWWGPPKDQSGTEKLVQNEQVERLNGSVQSKLNGSSEQYTEHKDQPMSTNKPITTLLPVVKDHTEPSTAVTTSKPSVQQSDNQSSTSAPISEPSTSKSEIQSAASLPTTEKLIPNTATESSTSSSTAQPSIAVTTTKPSVLQSDDQSSTFAPISEPSTSKSEIQSAASLPTTEKLIPSTTTESSTSSSATEPSIAVTTTKPSVPQSDDQSSTSAQISEPSTSKTEIQSAASLPTTEKLIPSTTTKSSTSSSATEPSTAVTTTKPSVPQSDDQSSTSAPISEPSTSKTEIQSAASLPTTEILIPSTTTESSTSSSATEPSTAVTTTKPSVPQSDDQSSTSAPISEPSTSKTEIQSAASLPTTEKLMPSTTTESSTSSSATEPLTAVTTTKPSVPQSDDQSSTSAPISEPSTSKTEIQSAASLPTTEKLIPSTTTESSTSSSATQPSTAVTTTEPSVSQSDNRSLTSALTAEPSISDTVTSAAGNQVASRMLFYMNHAADACEDFYEYACGEFEANHLMSENDLAKQATRRIFDQVKKNSISGQDTEFQGYYQSCVNYHKNSTRPERIEFAKAAIGGVGKFFEEARWSEDLFNLTTMLSELLLRNSAPLFDITVDVAVDDHTDCSDQVGTPKITWKLSPPILESNSYRDQMERDCYNKLASAILKEDVDLSELYNKHTFCKNDLNNFLNSVQEALENLSGLNSEDIQNARYGIEVDLMPAFYKTYPDLDQKSKNNPTKGQLHEAYITKEYTTMKIGNLQQKLPTDEPFLNLTQLLETLKGSTVELEQPLQVYFPDVILKGLYYLYNLPVRRHLNNALLGLYAHKLYYEFVVSPPNVEDHCERVATSLMRTHASSLYMSSFSSEELADMKDTVTGVFDKLKSTLESGLRNSSWLGKTEETEIVQKIRGLTMEIPDMSYYQNDHKLNTEYNAIKETLTGKFFDDTMMLQKNYRKSMYKALDESPSDHEQIWTHFGLPHQTAGSAIYGLNKIIVPYGAIDWSVVWSAKNISSNHLVFATLGTRIAELIAHHFDSTGVQYIAGRRTRDPPAVFCSSGIDAAQTYSNYIEGNRSPFDDVKKLVLPSTGQNVQYAMTDLSLNERFSATTGLQLAYDTILGLPSESKKLLPWLTDTDTDVKKQFFLAYAQMHCTKVPVTSSFASLYEDEHLPSRLRILAAASSNKAWGSTWRNCAIGSNIHPEHIPSPFPHLEVEKEDDDQQVTE